MASHETFQTAQGLHGERITLEGGETAVINLDRNIQWDRGGVSWTVFPGTGGTLEVSQSLEATGDDWVPDPGDAEHENPFEEVFGSAERNRISRIQCIAAGAGGDFVVLSPAKFDLVLT